MARDSTKTRRICFEKHRWQDANGRWRMTCAGCGLHIDPVRDAWIADHYVRHAEGGNDEQTHPLCKRCNAAKTPTDIKAVAHGKRMGERHFGVKRSKGFAKPKGAKFDWSQGRYVRDSE